MLEKKFQVTVRTISGARSARNSGIQRTIASRFTVKYKFWPVMVVSKVRVVKQTLSIKRKPSKRSQFLIVKNLRISIGKR